MVATSTPSTLPAREKPPASLPAGRAEAEFREATAAPGSPLSHGLIPGAVKGPDGRLRFGRFHPDHVRPDCVFLGA